MIDDLYTFLEFLETLLLLDYYFQSEVMTTFQLEY